MAAGNDGQLFFLVADGACSDDVLDITQLVARIRSDLAVHGQAYVVLPEGYRFEFVTRPNKRLRRLARSGSATTSPMTQKALERWSRDMRRPGLPPLTEHDARYAWGLVPGPSGRLTWRWKADDGRPKKHRRTSRSWANGRGGGR